MKTRARERKAKTFLKLAEELASIAIRIEWETNDLDEDAAFDLAFSVETSKSIALRLGQAIAQGTVKIRGISDGMPLFDEPKKPDAEPIQIKTGSIIDFVRCNHCGWTKPKGDPSPCPSKHVAGFGIVKPPPSVEEIAADIFPEPKPEVTDDTVDLKSIMCKTCGHIWLLSEGVGCPKCIHEPVKMPTNEDDIQPPKKFIVKSSMNRSLYCLVAFTLAEAEAYTTENHPRDWGGSVEEITESMVARLPSWITTRDITKGKPNVQPVKLPHTDAPGGPDWTPQAEPTKTTRKPQSKSFIVMYRDEFDESNKEIEIDRIKATSFEEAKAMIKEEYDGRRRMLPDGSITYIRYNELNLYEIPPKPRKKKETDNA
jgi:hypothetical protein